METRGPAAGRPGSAASLHPSRQSECPGVRVPRSPSAPASGHLPPPPIRCHCRWLGSGEPRLGVGPVACPERPSEWVTGVPAHATRRVQRRLGDTRQPECW